MKKMKKIKKSKKIYSKVKAPTIYTNKILENNIQKISHLYELDNVWTKFIDKVIYKKQYDLLENFNENNLVLLLNEISNPLLKNQILKILMKYENYNPFNSNIPLDIFPSNLLNYIIKKQKYIKENLNFINAIKKDDIILLVAHNNYLIEPKVFLQSKCTILILYTSEQISFHISNKENYNLKYLHKVLNYMEKDKWFLHKKEKLLKTAQGKKTSLNYKYIIKEMI